MAVLAGIVLGVIIIPPLLGFFRKVARLRRDSQMSAIPTFEPMQFEQLPAHQQEGLAQPAPALAVWAFRVATYARTERGFGSQRYLAIWVRPATGDRAIVSVTDFPHPRQNAAVQPPAIAFETSLSDGTSIMTRGGLAHLRKAGPKERWLICPEVRNVNHLYDVHRNWVLSIGGSDRLGVLPPVGDELASVQQDALVERQRLIALGYWHHVTDDALGLTWKGAWVIARQMRPAAALALQREASKKLRSLGFWHNGTPRKQVHAFEVVQTARCPVGRPPISVAPLDDSGKHADGPES